jgi:bifunctional enzyme CysN/CysC
VWPSGHSAHVKSIEAWPESTAPERAEAGRSVGITLDEQLFVQRGDVLAHPAQPPRVSTVLSANVFWLGRRSLEAGQPYRLRMTTLERDVSVFAINRVMSAASMEVLEGAGAIPRNDVGEVILRATRPLVFDAAATLPSTGRFVLLDGHDIVGGGIVLEDEELYRRPYGPSYPRSAQIASVPAVITADERALAYGHRSHVVWLTGMPGVGKSTLARYLERRLFSRGVKTVVLDGEHLRLGLSADLKFSDADRGEQARRVAEVARLFHRAGLVVIVALVSPFRTDREFARRVIGAEDFTLVYLHAPVGILRERERHGLYAAAGRDDEVKIPGVNAPYEPPTDGALVFDTASSSLATIGEAVIAAVERRIR